jgi:hypothetical protein
VVDYRHAFPIDSLVIPPSLPVFIGFYCQAAGFWRSKLTVCDVTFTAIVSFSPVQVAATFTALLIGFKGLGIPDEVAPCPSISSLV